MDPLDPQNSNDNNNSGAPQWPNQPPDTSQPPLPEQPAVVPAPQVVSPANQQPAPQPPVIQDNHKILNEYGSPAFPTPAPDSLMHTEPKESHKKLIVVLAIAIVVLLAGSAAAYFGYVVPNKPENIWKSALTNTSKGYDQLVTYSDNAEKVKDWTQKGSFKLGGAASADATFEGKSSGTTSQYTGSVSATGLKIGFDVRTLPTQTNTPDLYVKVDGLQGLGNLLGAGNPQAAAALNGINNQWYVVDHSLFDEIKGATDSKASISSSDVTDFLKTAGSTTKQYVFTSDPNQSILTMKEKVGKETKDGRSVYHYKVALDKDRTKSYLQALCDDFKKSKLAEASNAKSYDCADFTKSANDIKESDTADAWVDTQTKLFHAVRFTDTEHSSNYLEITQNYTGGDVLPFGLNYVYDQDGSKVNIVLSASINKATNEVKVTGNFGGSEDSGKTKYNGNLDVTIEPSQTAVKVDKPANAKSIIELANDLGLGSYLSGSTTALPSDNLLTSPSDKSQPAIQAQAPGTPLARNLQQLLQQNGRTLGASTTQRN